MDVSEHRSRQKARGIARPEAQISRICSLEPDDPTRSKIRQR
jgi:hypothetical protein